MKYENITGFVLSSSPINESDLLISFFTKEHGRISALAKGVRKISSKRRPSLVVFNKVSVQLYSGKMGLVRECLTLNSFPKIRKDIRKLSVAYFVCDVIRKICAEKDPHPEIFDILNDIFENISYKKNLKTARIDFIKKVLLSLGFVPQDYIFVDTDKTLQEVLERELPSLRVGRMLQ